MTNNTQAVMDFFTNQQKKGMFPGGQIHIRSQGKVILDEAVGIARGARDEEEIISMDQTTQCPVYSCGKPLAAIAIAHLEDHQRLDIHAPIADIFPEFAKNSKSNITTYDVLTHRSGIMLMSPELSNQMNLWGDREFVQTLLINAIPRYPRGTLAYSPGDCGWILSEIVMRVDGRSLSDYFDQEIAQALSLPNLKFGLAGRPLNSLAYTYWFGKDKLMMAGMNIADGFEELNNSKDFFNCKNPAFTLISDAASLSAFYEFIINGGYTKEGKQLISSDRLKAYTQPHVYALDKTTKAFLSVGQGFLTGTLLPSFYGWWNTKKCFGHAGLFSSLAFGDFNSGVSAAIITNGNRGVGDFMKRFIPLAGKIRNIKST